MFKIYTYVSLFVLHLQKYIYVHKQFKVISKLNGFGILNKIDIIVNIFRNERFV